MTCRSSKPSASREKMDTVCEPKLMTATLPPQAAMPPALPLAPPDPSVGIAWISAPDVSYTRSSLLTAFELVTIAVQLPRDAAGAATSAYSRVQIKQLTATEAPAAIAFYFALLCSLFSGLTWFLGWADPSPRALVFLIGAGLMGGLAHILMTEAIAMAPASSLAPFEYTAMLWALLFDALVFASLPSLGGFLGAVLIVGAAITVAFADMVARRR